MELYAVPYAKVKKKREVRELYHTAFPKEEQLPFWLLSASAYMRGVELSCYFDADHLVGFAHVTRYRSIVFVMFFAVSDAVRGMGYGSAILAHLRAQNEGLCVVLNVEPLDPSAENYEERERRMRFYEKNGFYDTGYEIDEVGGTFNVLSTVQTPSMQEYLGVFRRLSFGVWRPRLAPRDGRA